MATHKVMFVCTGNICRSPLAHAVLEDLASKEGLQESIEVESSGIHAYHVGENADARMRRTAAQHGVRLDHMARLFRPDDLRSYDLVLAMDRSHLREMERVAAGDVELQRKVRLFGEFLGESGSTDRERAQDVPDPYYGGQDGFERVFEMVSEGCANILQHLRNADRR